MAALPAHASLVVYTSSASWTAAVTAVTTIDFEGLAAANSSANYSTSAGITLPATTGVQFTGFLSMNSYDLSVVNPGSTSTYYNFGSGASLKGPINTNSANFLPYVHVKLPTNITAFSVDLMTVSPNALNYQITLANGSVFTVATSNIPTRTFFGITSDTPIGSADFAVLGSTTANGLMDNFSYGTTSETSEVGTLLLIGSGLIGFRMLRPRRAAMVAQAA